MVDTTTVRRRAANRPHVRIPGRQRLKSEFEHIVWPYRLALPFMVVTAVYVHIKKVALRLVGKKPTTNCWYVDGISKNSRNVTEGAARWPALDACYNFTVGEGSNALIRAIDRFWMRVRNAQAVRNRFVIAKRELRRALDDRLSVSQGSTVNIVSLAAGSAQAVIEVLAEFQRVGRNNIRATLIDFDDSALENAQKLASQHGVSDRIEIRKGDVLFFERVLGDIRPDIIEMIGLMDYLRDKLAISLLRKIRRQLREDGLFLTCHIHPNAEGYFLRQVVNWSMLYRSVDEFGDILIESGFLGSAFHTEPHEIHTVAVARKVTTI